MAMSATTVSMRPVRVPDEEVRHQLKLIVGSNGFFRAQRMQRFLTFVVEASLDAKSQSIDLKESVIGVAVFDRPPDYDPKSDPVVRVEARRLRSKLEEYYQGPGCGDPVSIDLPKGSYVPVWSWRQAEQIPVPEPVSTPRRNTRALVLICWAAVAVMSVLAGIVVHRKWGDWFAQPEAAAKVRIRSLAILPFRNLSRDGANEYMADGLTDELTTELARIGDLKVVSRTSADQYRSTHKHLPQIARELNVDAIVEGTLLSSPDSVRVSAQLIRAATDSHLWAETYERSGSNFVTLNSEIAAKIAQQIGLTLRPEPRARTKYEPANPEAYEAYLKGRFFWNKRTLDGLEKSIGCFKRAILLDPKYGSAYAGLGDSYVLLSSYGGPSPERSLFLAREAAQRALVLDSGLAEAHTVLAAVKIDEDWDWQGATREFLLALQLSPSYPTAHHWYALHLSRLGRSEQAEAEIKRALDLDPLSLIILTDAAEVFYCSRKPEQARAYIKRAFELDPNFAEAHLESGKVYEQEGDLPRAVDDFERANQLFGGAPNIWALKAHALALQGKRDEAVGIAEKLVQVSRRRYVSGVDIAIAFCGLGEQQQAMHWLQKAYATRDKGLDILGTDPLFDGCRSDPAFREMLTKLQLTH